jgi:hypothetical protein
MECHVNKCGSNAPPSVLFCFLQEILLFLESTSHWERDMFVGKICLMRTGLEFTVSF